MKVGRNLVCSLSNAEITEFVAKQNAALQEISEDFLKKSGVDLSKVSDLDTLVDFIDLPRADGTSTSKCVTAVNIEFFLEE